MKSVLFCTLHCAFQIFGENLKKLYFSILYNPVFVQHNLENIIPFYISLNFQALSREIE